MSIPGPHPTTQTQATTIPEAHNWPQLKCYVFTSPSNYVVLMFSALTIAKQHYEQNWMDVMNEIKSRQLVNPKWTEYFSVRITDSLELTLI